MKVVYGHTDSIYVQVDSVEKLRKFNQHRSEYVAAPKATFAVASDSQTLKFRKRKTKK